MTGCRQHAGLRSRRGDDDARRIIHVLDDASRLARRRYDDGHTAEQAAQRANETAAAAIADTVAPSPNTAAPAAEPKTAAELIAARFHDLPGVTVTIKGAQTTSPVVWLAGDTDPHADAIKAQGGKWSNKRAAYYVRVA